MNSTIYFYEDFCGCTYVLCCNKDGTYDLSVRLPRGDLYIVKSYSTWRGARIAIGKISEGTAKPTGRKEVI